MENTPTIKGPQGTGAQFQRKVAELVAKGMNEIRARRIASGAFQINKIKKTK